MKVRFDTNTRNIDAATKAYGTLYKYCEEIRLDKSSWQDGVINLSGDIDSTHISTLEEVTANDFNDDADKL